MHDGLRSTAPSGGRAVQRVAIVGGGIGGLALAAALDPRRFAVTIYEAEPARARLGGGLVLWPSTMRALERLGGAKPLRDNGIEVRGGIHTLQGAFLRSAPDLGLLLVARPVLLAALQAAVPSSVRVEESTIHDPRTLDADVVVGADGVRSVVRGLIEPGRAQRLPTPYVALRGPVHDAVAADEEGEYWGPGALFGVVGAGGREGYWFTTHRSALQEPLAVPDVVGEFRRHLGRAGAPVIDRVLASAGRETTATGMWTTSALRRYVRGRYVVIGDAAHAMTPNLGRGACDAILDATSLADALAAGNLTRWQARRVPVTQAARITAGLVMRTALLDRGHAARDRLMRGLPG